MNKRLRTAQKQYCHWMKALKKDVSPEQLASIPVDELERQIEVLKIEVSAEQERAKQEKAVKKQKNIEHSGEGVAQAEERRARSVLVSFDTEQFVNQLKAICGAHGEVESLKVGMSAGKVPECQVRFKTLSAAQSMMGANQSKTISLATHTRNVPTLARTVTVFPDASVSQEGGGAAAVAAVKESLSNLAGVINLSSGKGQVQIEFATEIQANDGLIMVNSPAFQVGGRPLRMPAWKGFPRKHGGEQNNSKKRKMDVSSS